MPVSEGIIYYDQDKEPYNVKEAFPFGHGEYGGAVSYMVLPKALRDEVRNKYEGELTGGENLVFKEPLLIAPPIPAFSIPIARKAALGLSIVPLYPGVDATVHLLNDVWLTGSVQSPLFSTINTEFILQRPIYRIPYGGVSVGVFHRYNHLNYFREGEDVRLRDLVPSTFPLSWYGGRITARLPDNVTGRRFRFHLNGGYSGEYDAALFTLGIGISIRPRPHPGVPDHVRY